MSPGHQAFRRSLAFSAFLSLAGASQALTLGPAQLQSQADETLLVSIPLSERGDIPLNSLNVSLEAEDAQDEAFIRRLAWRVEAANAGSGRIVLQSPAPLPEEGLRVRLEVRWAEGEAARNYTLSANSVSFAEPSLAALEESAPELDDGDGYQVQADDTLWQIASRLSPAVSASPQQVMLAIQRLNPQAFAEGNINRMIAGSRLRLPSVEDVQRVAEGEAVQRVAEQNAAVGLQGAALFGLETGEGQDALRIVTGEVTAAEDRIAAIEQRLMLSEESLDQARLTSRELQSRLQDMDEQIEVLDIIVELESQRVNERQQALADAAPTLSEPLSGSAVTGASQAGAVSASSTSPVSEEPAVSTGVAMPGTPPARRPADWQAALLEALRQPFVLGGLMAGLVVLMLAVLVIRRRRDEAAREQAFGLPLEPVKPTASAVNYWDPAGAASQEWLTDDLPRSVPPTASERLVFEQLSVDENAFTDTALEAEPEEDELQGMLPEEASQLDLAVAYHGMGRHTEARAAVNKVLEEGTAAEISEARRLLKAWDSAASAQG